MLVQEVVPMHHLLLVQLGDKIQMQNRCGFCTLHGSYVFALGLVQRLP